LALKELDYVDSQNVFLFGHSMGGIQAPLIASDTPVRGIAVFGSGASSWFEAVYQQRRRLAALDGTKAEDIDQEVLRQVRFWYPLLVQKKTPREILDADPELDKLGWVTDDKYVGGRHYAFHHQLAGKNTTEAWSKVAASRLSDDGKIHPRVLALWGTSDWLVDRAGNAWIAEVVNRVSPGSGTFVELPAIDHFFLRTATQEESYAYFKPTPGLPATEFNTNLLEALTSWLDQTVAKAAQG
jgi:pimeloyl-ACP methyl ester carboxylesterase